MYIKYLPTLISTQKFQKKATRVIQNQIFKIQRSSLMMKNKVTNKHFFKS